MSRYRTIATRIWNDVKFRSLSPEAQLVFFYLLTTPSGLPIPGAVVGGPASLAEEMGTPPETLSKGLAELFQRGLAKGDLDARLVWLPNAIKYRAPENPNQVKGMAKYWDDVPECSLKHELWRALESVVEPFEEALGKPFAELFPEPWLNPTANQEQDQDLEKDPELEKEKDQGRSRVRVTSPRKKKSGPDAKLIAETARTVVAAFNACFERNVGSQGSEAQIKALLARGYTEPQMRAVMWWAGEEWAADDDWRMKVSPTTMLKLTSSNGNRTFPQYLELASELWRTQKGQTPPWESEA